MNEDQKQHVDALCSALESGQFLQGRGRLLVRSGDGSAPDRWCCLGVACEVFRIQTGQGAWHPNPGEDGMREQLMHFEIDNEVNGVYLPKKVAEWYGFPEALSDSGIPHPQNPALVIPDEQRKEREKRYPGIVNQMSAFGRVAATSLNDSYDWAFRNIAAAFRRTFLEG